MPPLPERRRARFARSAEKRRRRLKKNFGLLPAGSDSVERSAEGRNLPLLVAAYKGPVPKVCVVIHAYYIDSAAELLSQLRNICIPFDLFVTTPSSQAEILHRLCARILPQIQATVLGARNRGRNFGPMLVELSSRILQYDLLLHLHTKKSLRTGGEQREWREHIVDHLVGSSALINGVLAAFQTEPALGVVGPITYPGMPYWCHHWLSVQHRLEPFFERLGLASYPRIGFLDFPVGGMFWARVAALRSLLNAGWSYDDFDPEPALNDGTLAHVIERSIGVIAGASGYCYGETDLEANTLRTGTSEKGLSEYFASLPDRIARLRTEADTVSFDFYDTLFTRFSVRPEDVQSAVGHRLASEGLLPPGADFLKCRKAAEARARRVKGQGDVSSSEIYAAFPSVAKWAGAATKRAEALEREIEGCVLRARAPVLALARELASLGKRVLVVSDTYVDAAFMAGVLEAHGAGGVFAETLASSEVGLRKDTGAIWPWLRDRETAARKRYVHVGDNEHSDMQIPGSFGVGSMGLVNTAVLADLRKCPMPPGWREGRSDWRSGVLLGPLVARVGEDPFSPPPRSPFRFDDARDLGYCVFGPMAFAFMSWLARRVAENGIDRCYFLARGAYFLHRLYEKLSALDKSLPPASYLMASRRSVLPAAFATTEEPSWILSGAGDFKGTFATLLEARLGMSSERLGAFAGTPIRLPRDRERAAQLVAENFEAIVVHCVDAKRKVVAYLAQEGLLDAKRPALVDLGYSATIQKALQAATGRPLGGYYFATQPAAREAEAQGGHVEAYFGMGVEGQPAPEILRHDLLLEAFFAGPSGQVDGYADHDGLVAPVHGAEPEAGMNFVQLRRVAEGMEAYCLELARAYGPAILRAEYDPDLALEPFRRLTSGWGGIPECLRLALLVEDEFCGRKTPRVLSVPETP
jgi:FMN phosphatase YigB (HAD superfamily)